MKKLLFITLLFAIACGNSSYKNNDNQLTEGLKGTWQGSVYLNDEEIPTDYQFFESADGKTGKFIEIAYLHEIDGDYDIRYFAYVSGEYVVKDGKLSLTYYPETTSAEAYDEDALEEYATALIEYYTEEGREILWEDASELAFSILEVLEEEWSEVCEERNNSMADFENLTISEDKMSFVADNRTLEFTKAEQDWFTAFPFDE